MPMNVTFTSNKKVNTQERRDAEKKAVAGGGAIAATTTAARAKATKSGFDMFSSAQKVSKGMQTVTTGSKTVANVAKKTSSLWTKVVENAKWAKNAILNWGTKFKNIRFIKPLVQNSVFKFGAGAIGYAFGAVTLISGLSDITKASTDIVEKLNNK
jgi:hypothetical protein